MLVCMIYIYIYIYYHIYLYVISLYDIYTYMYICIIMLVCTISFIGGPHGAPLLQLHVEHPEVVQRVLL